MPAVLRALSGAVAVNCLSNLKQLGMAFLLYSESHAGYLPHEDYGSAEPPFEQCWYQVLDDYLDAEPKHRAKQDPKYMGLHSADIEKLGFSFKMNSRLEDYKGKRRQPSPPFRRLSSLESPQATVLLFDGHCDKNPYLRQSYGMYTSVIGRHDGRAGLLFGDGQCKQVTGISGDGDTWSGPGGFIWDPDSPVEQQE